MATGDAADMASRQYAVLPSRWFPSLAEAPILNGILSGVGQAWSFIFSLLAYARLQTRIATATGAFLDMTALDYEGSSLGRRPQESDASFRARISAELLREKATRAAILLAVTRLTQAGARVFEPMRPADTGGYGTMASPGCGGGAGYGAPGQGYGSLTMPFQFFVDANNPAQGPLQLSIMGYAELPAAFAGGSNLLGGYGVGAIEYGTTSLLQDMVTREDIDNAILGTMPVAATAWVRMV